MKQEAVKKIWQEYEKSVDFKTQIDLYETVENNENFFIGKQWEGVQSNGLPTPTFNFIKRIILFLVASTSTDNIKISASPLSSTGMLPAKDMEQFCKVINAQFEALFEQNKMGKLIREFMRNSAVDGDGCIYTWFDPDVETGQTAKGAIRAEILENTRVAFGDPHTKDVQGQPYILISRREFVDEVKERAKKFGGEPDNVKADSDDAKNRYDALTDGKCTTVMKLWRNKKTGTIWAVEITKDAVVRPEWDLGLKRYPIVWMPWDYVQNCYHGQAAVTGLIPNQVFVNKMFAMTMISLMTTAFPKVVYDKTRVAKWDSRVGSAIGVNGGDVNSVAKTIDPAAISPQVSQFIELAIGLTKEFLGATDAALGDTRPDNTSAIIALQKASAVPMEMVKQNLFQCVEDLGNIWLDMMRAHYGTRYVEVPRSEALKAEVAPLLGADGRPMLDQPRTALFDFSMLEQIPMSIKLDVGGSAYWSEIAQMNTLDNLLMNGQITVIDYLERIPNGYISGQQELIDTLRQRQKAASLAAPQAGGEPEQATVFDANQPVDVPIGPGNRAMQRALQEGVGLKLTKT
jgi:hypothetical protein